MIHEAELLKVCDGGLNRVHVNVVGGAVHGQGLGHVAHYQGPRRAGLWLAELLDGIEDLERNTIPLKLVQQSGQEKILRLGPIQSAFEVRFT